MPTIAVLAELLIAGVQAMVWLYLLISWPLGWNWLSFERDGAGANVQTLLVVALAYTLGVVVDRLADSLLTTVDNRFRLRPWTAVSPEKMRVRVLLAGGEAAAYLGYMRSRLRVARATVFNLGAAAITLLLLAKSEPVGGPSPQTLIGASVAALGAGLISFWVAYRIGKTYDERLSQTYHQLTTLRSRD